MFYKIVENRLVMCPKNGTVNGKAISNLPRYFEKNPKIAKAEGYKPLDIDDKPEYNPDTQYLTFAYEDTDEAIIKHWTVNDNEPFIEETTSLEERVSTVEAKCKAMEIVFLGVE